MSGFAFSGDPSISLNTCNDYSSLSSTISTCRKFVVQHTAQQVDISLKQVEFSLAESVFSLTW